MKTLDNIFVTKFSNFFYSLNNIFLEYLTPGFGVIYICVAVAIIGIVVYSDRVKRMMEVAFFLDSDADFRRRQRPKFINVAYTIIPVGHREMIFVRDIYDPTGINLMALFADKAYDLHTHGNYNGFLKNKTNFTSQVVTLNDGSQSIRVPVLSDRMSSVESRGFVVTSGIINTPITVDFSLEGGRSLQVKEHV